MLIWDIPYNSNDENYVKERRKEGKIKYEKRKNILIL